MRPTQIIFLTLVVFSLHAQDSLRKPSLKLFDLQTSLNLGGSALPEANMSMMQGYTRHKEYVSEEFTRGYSDTIAGFSRRHGITGLNAEIGISVTFQFQQTSSRLLRRLKPRLGLYHNNQKMINYTLGHYKNTTIDSLRFVNPIYPPIAVDSVNSGEIRYTYTSNRIFAELGVNADILVTRRIILYAGCVYDYGLGYNNRFSVWKEERSYLSTEKNNTSSPIPVNEQFREGYSITSRFLFPVGIQQRFTYRHKFTMGFFGEIRPGFYTFRTEEGASAGGGLFNVSAGLRLSFQYHK